MDKCIDCNNPTDCPEFDCCKECYEAAAKNEKEHSWDCKCVIHR